MKINIRKIFKNEFVLLTLFLIKQWFTLKHLNQSFNAYSKHRYILTNNTEFIRKYQNYYDSTRLAYKDMQNWLQKNKQDHKLLFNEKNVTLCVGILSQRRYSSIDINVPIESTVALLVRTRLKYQREIRIDVLNVEEAGQLRSDLKELVDLVNIVDLRANVPIKFPGDHTSKMKELIDYIYAMVYYSSSIPQCKYVLLLEDDSLPSPDWYNRIMEAIDTIDTSSNNWFCLKLFTSFRYYDWLIHIPTIFISICMAIFISFIFVRLFYFVLYLKHRFIFQILRPQIPVSKYVVLIFAINAILMLFMYRANHVSPIGYGVRSFSLGFNTVANVYPRDKLRLIASYLESGFDDFQSGRAPIFQPKDLSLNSFRYHTGYREYIVEPSIFQHVGLQSSLGGPVTWQGIESVQYRPFQSYSFEKEYSKIPIRFDPTYWTS